MKRIHLLLLLVFFASCGRNTVRNPDDRIITISIAPFKYFVESIAGSDFKVNIMVPAGSDPHIYEPFPDQIGKLRISEGYISNGYLGFEMAWLDRFYETNREMKKLSLGDFIEPVEAEHEHEGDHVEGADPHYWVSPKCAMQMALAVKNFIIELNPADSSVYQANYSALLTRLQEMDKKATDLLSGLTKKTFMIYHPNLAYLARDYGLKEIAVEFEGKEPTPSRMRELIDLARKEDIKTIFVQREYDTRNARSIAKEIDAELVIIDPLSENWTGATMDLIEALHQSLN